ncbi:MAG: hypothetical protein JNL97_05140 [Verrucomicrobiales bacterium]|nr:hypothetical protein [Verrucomicrobiales bacterium]
MARVHHRLADQEAPSIVPRVRSTVVRYITAAAWGVAGGILLVRRGPSDAGRSRATESLAGRACLAAAVVEVSDLGRFFGEAVRAVARAVSAYDGRETGQQWATALLLASALGLGGKWLASDRAPGHRLLMTSIVTGLGLLALDALSLHAIDRLAQYPCLGLPAVQVGGLVCSFVAAATGALVRHGPLPRPR